MNDMILLVFIENVMRVGVFMGSFRMIYVLSKSFMSSALDSMALRFGWSSEIIALIVIRMSLCAPEMGISLTDSLTADENSFGNLALRVILGSGWITFLLLPVLAGLRKDVSVSVGLLLREFCMYVIAIGSLYQIVVDGASPVLWWSVFMGSYAVYLGMLCYGQRLIQLKRRIDRESQLLYRLAPLDAILEGRLAYGNEEYLERVPIHLVGTQNSIPIVQPVSSDLGLLRYICVRAIPGTQTEKYCLISLMNVFVLQLIFSGLIGWVAKGWIATMLTPGGLLESVLIALFAQSVDIVGILAGTHTLACSLSCQNLAVFVGLGLPWLVRLIAHGSHQTKMVVSNSFVFSGLALVSFLIYCACNTRGTKQVHFGNFKYFFFLYPALVLNFLLIEDS